MSNIVLSEKLLSEQGISVIEFITLLTIGGHFSEPPLVISDDILNLLQDKLLIKRSVDGEVTIRKMGKDLIKDFQIDKYVVGSRTYSKTTKKSPRKLNDDVLTNLKDYRAVFKGLKAGSMGDPKACREKLSRWLDENPEYSMKEVINAAKVYVNSVNDVRFLRRADYFIYKKENNGEEISTLSAIIDDVDIQKENDDWLSNFI